jgi:hypothetical protein
VKLTVKAADPTLFSRDKHSEAVFSLECGEEGVNDVRLVQIKDSKYQEQFVLRSLGNGEYGIRFLGDSIPVKLVGKPLTLTLNVWLQGNESPKPNTTVTLKLNIVK